MEDDHLSALKPKIRQVFPAWMVLAALGLAAGLLWPLVLHPNHIPMPPVTQSSDLMISHLANARYLHRTLAEHGQPLAADPLAGIWYLPNWLAVFFPQPWAFNLLFLLHLGWAGLGLFSFLRAEGRSPAAAFLRWWG